MKKTLTVIVLAMIVVILFGELKSMSNRCAKYERYYQATEQLLDKISIEDNSFMDTVGETDEYSNYLEYRNPLDL